MSDDESLEVLLNSIEVENDTQEILNIIEEIDSSENNNFVINENSPTVQQPDNIIIPLKPHQLAMIYAMKNLEQSYLLK